MAGDAHRPAPGEHVAIDSPDDGSRQVLNVVETVPDRVLVEWVIDVSPEKFT